MRHLWLAVKEGIVEHRRALLALTASVAGFVVVVQVASYFASTQTAVCGTCHIMKPYVEMRRSASHADVSCVTCHTEWRFVLSGTYVRYALGLYAPQLRAEVPDKRCLSCHEKQDLDTDEVFLKGIHFSHRQHLGEMRRGKALHCTSCHGGHVIMEEHPAGVAHAGVQKEVCYTCHFKGAEKGQAATGCLVCHGPPTTVVAHQGFTFDHGSYLKRNVRCDHCHVEVTRGDANVPRGRCATCHVSRIEAYDDHERIHSIHLRDHLIDCARCHNLMEHGKVAMATALGERCDNCHKPQHTAQEQMYIGIGGQGVPDTPSTMFLARVACDSCHGEPGGDPRKGAAQLRQSCVTCHGPGFDRMVDDWINEIGALSAAVRGAVGRAEAQASALGDRGGQFREQLARARHNLDFIRAAHGEHNIRYAVELLRVARADAEDVLVKTGAGRLPLQPILASASGYCRVCHSTSHLGTRLAFADMEYDHNRHVGAGMTCETCHSVEEHGTTTIVREQCMGCHHGSGQKRSCESCHEAQADLYRGRLRGTEVTGDPDMMAAAVECSGCHDLASREPLVKAVQQACVGCHEAGYDEMLVEWINQDQARVQELAVLLTRAQRHSLAAAHRSDLAAADRIYQALVQSKGVHNQALAADAADRAGRLLSWSK